MLIMSVDKNSANKKLQNVIDLYYNEDINFILNNYGICNNTNTDIINSTDNENKIKLFFDYIKNIEVYDVIIVYWRK
jgi:hypothetical protein